MTKKEIAKTIAEEMGMTTNIVQEVIQNVLDAITRALVEEGRIELRNFGVFEVRKRKAKQARNPRTGQPAFVPEQRRVRFKPGMEMAEKVEKLGRRV